MVSTVFQLCKFYFALLISAYLHLQYFFSVYFSLHSLSLHFDICSIEVLDFTISAYLHLQYFSFVFFNVVSSSLHIDVCSVSVLYNLLSSFRLSILTSAVFSSVYFYTLLFFTPLCILTSSLLQFCIILRFSRLRIMAGAVF